MTRRHTAHFTGQEVLLPSAGAEEPRWPSAMHALSHCARIRLCARAHWVMRAQWAIATRKHPAVAAAAAAAAAVQGCGRAAANRVAHHQLNQGRQLAARRRSGKVAFKGPKPVAVSDGACVHVTCSRNAVGGGRRDPQAARLAAQGGGRGGSASRRSCPSWQAVTPAAPAGWPPASGRAGEQQVGTAARCRGRGLAAPAGRGRKFRPRRTRRRSAARLPVADGPNATAGTQTGWPVWARLCFRDQPAAHGPAGGPADFIRRRLATDRTQQPSESPGRVAGRSSWSLQPTRAQPEGRLMGEWQARGGRPSGVGRHCVCFYDKGAPRRGPAVRPSSAPGAVTGVVKAAADRSDPGGGWLRRAPAFDRGSPFGGEPVDRSSLTALVRGR